MTQTINIEDATVARLQKIAVPLADTFDSVINRVLDAYDAAKTAADQPSKVAGLSASIESGVMKFDAAQPPQLKFTTPTHITVDGKQLPKQITYWNNLLQEVIQAAHKKGHDAAAIKAMMVVANAAVGKKENAGYKYMPEVGLSIQGAEANAAFKEARNLATKNGIKFTVAFEWQNNERAAYPNRQGYIEM
ncbi:MAG: T4SS efffector SepA family protein [Caulobacteraceae bacterium]